MLVIQQGWYLEMNKIKKLFINNKNNGWFLISAIVMILFLTAVGLTISTLVTLQYQHVKKEAYTQNASLIAEAGIEQSVYELNNNNAFTGYGSPQVFFDNATQGKGVYTTSITNNSDGNSKTIISIGNLYQNDSATSPYSTRKIKVTVVGTSSEGYSVYTGPGGLILSGTANIVNSDVFVGGGITMTGTSKIGTISNPVHVDVGNMLCPTGSNPGSTYPQVCSNGNQPISMQNNTNIYGSVCATGQTSTGPNNNIQGGNGGSGLEVGCTAPNATPPSYDKSAQVAAVTTSGAGNSSIYNCTSKQTTRTWPANLKLTGDVTINGSCNVTVTGNVYITGNLTLSGSAKFIAANSLGTTRPIILVDGTITVSGSSTMIANNVGTGIEFISYQANASCNPNCTSLSGNDLYNSQRQQTITISGGSTLPGMVFDAYWGEITISGSGNIGTAIGQTVNLSGSGTVLFGTKLASGTQTWAITSYQPLYN